MKSREEKSKDLKKTGGVEEHLLTEKEWVAKKIYDNSDKDQIRQRYSIAIVKTRRDYLILTLVVLIYVFSVLLAVTYITTTEVEELNNVQSNMGEYICEQHGDTYWKTQYKGDGNELLVQCENKNIIIGGKKW